jgi:Pectate lyase superfamily protein
MHICRAMLGLAAMLTSLGGCAAVQTSRPGAVLPWTTYEAETAKSNGLVLGPDYIGQTPAREASGRQCVRLSQTGNFIEFNAKADANGIVVRYCLPPDSQAATLSLYVNDTFRSRLPMTSKYCYVYGKYPFNNNPASGSPRHFWDEVRQMPGQIHAGDTIRLEKDPGDLASQYLIDFIDLEAVPAPLPRPTNSLSVTDFGANAAGQADAHDPFIAAISAAKSAHKTVWIPAGEYQVKGPIQVGDVAIAGAGMWYSTLRGVDDYSPANRLAILGNGSNISLSDFAIIGNLTYRNDSQPNDGLGGSFGTGSSIRNIWVEHTKTGAWLVNSDGLLVEGCRFRDTIADGINLCLGMRNTLVRNCTARNTGDDCFAMWPATYADAKYPAGNNRFIHCAAQLPTLAQAFSVYGGNGNSVEDCQAIDIPYGAGLLVSTMFPTGSGFHGITTFRDVDITRAGDRDGAIAVMTNLRTLTGVRFQDINVLDSPTDGIKFTCVKGLPVNDIAFDRVRIVNPGLSGTGYGIYADAGAAGSAAMTDVSIANAQGVDIKNAAPATFNFVRNTDAAAVNQVSIQHASVAP